ncbi:MAG: hypothetical protein V4736_05315 [Bdellovibrionota bacterium]
MAYTHLHHLSLALALVIVLVVGAVAQASHHQNEPIKQEAVIDPSQVRVPAAESYTRSKPEPRMFKSSAYERK